MQNDFPLLTNFFTNVLEYYKEGQHVRWNEIKPNPQQPQQQQKDDGDEFLISAFKSSITSSNSSSSSSTTTTPCLYFVISNLADVHLVGALRADEMVATQRSQLAEKQIPEESMCEKVKNCCYSSSENQQQNLNVVSNNSRKSAQQGEGYSCKFFLFDNYDDENNDDGAKKGSISRKGKLVFKITTVFKVVESIHASFTLQADLFDVHDLLREFTSKNHNSEQQQQGNIIVGRSSTSALFLASSNGTKNEKSSSSKNRHHFVREYFIRPLLKQLSLMKSIAATGFALSCAKSEQNEEAVLVSLERHQQALLSSRNQNHHNQKQQLQQQKKTSTTIDVVSVPPIANNVARTYVEDAISWHRSQHQQQQQQLQNNTSISTIKLFSQFTTTSSSLSNIMSDRSHNDDKSGLTTNGNVTAMRDNINILSRHIQVEVLANDALSKNNNVNNATYGENAMTRFQQHHNQQRRQRGNDNNDGEDFDGEKKAKTKNNSQDDDDLKFLMMLDGGGKESEKTKNNVQNQKQNLTLSSSSSDDDDDDEESKKRRQHLQQQRKYDLRRL